MRGAKGLPVGSIPEQRLIALVGLDVVDYRPCGYSTIPLAHHAQGVMLQVYRPSPAPACVVSTLCGCAFVGAPAFHWGWAAHK
jgi:hypothetical protein